MSKKKADVVSQSHVDAAVNWYLHAQKHSYTIRERTNGKNPAQDLAYIIQSYGSGFDREHAKTVASELSRAVNSHRKPGSEASFRHAEREVSWLKETSTSANRPWAPGRRRNDKLADQHANAGDETWMQRLGFGHLMGMRPKSGEPPVHEGHLQPADPLEQDLSGLLSSIKPQSLSELSSMDRVLGSAPAEQSISMDPGESQSTQRSGSSDGEISTLDMIQMGLDATGIVEPTPFSDGLNALLSVSRAFSEPERFGAHMTNAVTSTISMIPYFGDFAKVGKVYGKNQRSFADAIFSAGNNRSRIGRAFRRVGAFGKSFQKRGKGVAGAAESVNAAVSALTGGGGAGGSGGGAGGAPSGPAGGGGAPSEGMDQSSARPNTAMQNVSAGIGAIGMLVSGAKLFLGIIESIQSSNRATLERNRDIARWSPEASAAYMRYDMGQLALESRRAQHSGHYLANLADSQLKVDKAAEEYRQPYYDAGLIAAKHLNDLATVLYNVASAADLTRGNLKMIIDLYNWWNPTKDKIDPTMLDTIGNELDKALKAKQPMKLPAANPNNPRQWGNQV